MRSDYSGGHPAVPAAELALHALARGVPAVVLGLRDAQTPADELIVERLMEIGFLPGETVQVFASGFPGGDPLAVRIGQAAFALRRHEAAWVRVAPRVQGAV